MNSHQPLAILKNAHMIAYQNCIPWFVTIELGLQCNLSCHHCYNFDRANPQPHHFQNYLSKERILLLINELKAAGTLMIAFSGGEAMLNPDIYDYIKQVRTNHLIAKLKTNGTLINKSSAQKLKESGLHDADISFYGSNNIEHDWLTNQDGSFQKTLDGTKALRALDIAVTMNFIIHKKNYHSIEKMIHLAENLGCQYSLSPELTARYDNTKMTTEAALTEVEYRELLTGPYRELFFDSNPDKTMQCECARTVCAINSTGIVYPCIGAPIPSGNILKNNFKEIWENSTEFQKIRNLKSDDFKTCSNCDLLANCTRSSGSAFVNTGNYTGPNPQNCMEATVRSELSF